MHFLLAATVGKRYKRCDTQVLQVNVCAHLNRFPRSSERRAGQFTQPGGTPFGVRCLATNVTKGIATNVARTLLVAPGLTTGSK